MKVVIAVALLLASGSAPSAVHKNPASAVAAAPTSNLPPFDFKGIVAGVTVPPGTLPSCSAGYNDPMLVDCALTGSTVAGVDVTGSYQFYDDKLSQMTFVSAASNFSTILNAFSTKYGNPCSVDHPKWRNRAGGVFDNTVVTWCFATGKLELSQMSTSLEWMSAQYLDRIVTLPIKPPKSTFEAILKDAQTKRQRRREQPARLLSEKREFSLGSTDERRACARLDPRKF